jgi:SAM-dependent methyltransferase
VAYYDARNRALWDRWSASYQATHGAEIAALPDAWGAWRVPEAELRVLPDVRGRDVLELGCGGGQWSLWLAQRGARVVGLDLSAAQLGHASAAARAAGSPIAFVQASAEHLPFVDGSFDLLLSDHGAMSWADPDRTVPEAARVLRPDGLLVFCVSSPLFRVCWDDAADAAADRLHRDYFGMHAVPESGGASSFALPYGEWIRRFRAHHLAVEALVEPQPPDGAVSSFFGPADAWARRWPAEAIWKVRREPTSS